MKKNPYKGKFVVFEGLDGAGSSTQAALLKKNIEKRNKKVLLTKEPTNNIIGGLIRGQLTGNWKSNMECLQLLFAADRAHHLQFEIIPALKKSICVICDRYFFSTVAFGSLDTDKNWLLELNKNFILPDFTFFLDVSPSICIKRIVNSRLNLELFEEEQKLKKVRQTYLWLSKKFSHVFVLDGEKTENQIGAEVLNLCATRKS